MNSNSPMILGPFSNVTAHQKTWLRYSEDTLSIPLTSGSISPMNRLKYYSKYHLLDFEYFLSLNRQSLSEPELSDVMAYYNGTDIEVYAVINIVNMASDIREKFKHRNYIMLYRSKVYFDVAYNTPDYPLVDSGLFLFRIPLNAYDGAFDPTTKEPIISLSILNQQQNILFELKIPVMNGVDAPKYKMAACAYVSHYNPVNEVLNWISYHSLLGVTHFMLYNSDDYPELECALSEWIVDGLVSLVKWRWRRGDHWDQLEQNNNQIAQIHSSTYRMRYRAEMIILCDVDEYWYIAQPSEIPNQSFIQYFENQFLLNRMSQIIAGSIYFISLPNLPPLTPSPEEAASGRAHPLTQSTDITAAERDQYFADGKFFCHFNYRSGQIYSSKIVIQTKGLRSQISNHFGNFPYMTTRVIEIAHYKINAHTHSDSLYMSNVMCDVQSKIFLKVKENEVATSECRRKV